MKETNSRGNESGPRGRLAVPSLVPAKKEAHHMTGVYMMFDIGYNMIGA
jgi:hypothetical protein